jgi:muramoyltetrapeptide carboxypeptidase
MKILIPKPLNRASQVRVIAPSCSGKTIKASQIKTATDVLTKTGFRLSFGKNVFKLNQFESSDRASRLEDLHQAFADPNVDGILAVRGGYNANDLLDFIDWELIRKNPKMYCGFSDNTVLQNAVFKKTGLITYSGPNLATFGKNQGLNFTLKNFLNATVEQYAQPTKNKDQIVMINPGQATGTIIGGNLCTLNLLQGTPYMPELAGSILFLEDDHMSDRDWWEFHRNLQSLIHLPDFAKVRALVFGTFDAKSKLPPSVIKKMIKAKPELNRIPVIANVTFGHTLPMLTFPIGGKAKIDTNSKSIYSLTA